MSAILNRNMFVLNTSVAAMTPILLPKYGLIAQKLIPQRTVNYAAAALVKPGNHGFNLQHSQNSTLATTTVSRTLCLGHIAYREYVTKKSEDVQTSPQPTPPNLPQKEQIERACFRVIAFLWDCGFFIISTLRKFLKVYVIEDPTVQLYWKRFHEKMAESKKNDKE